MKFWKNNRVDAEFDKPVEEVARLYLASKWADHPWPLDRKLRAFLTDPDGPISASWEDEQAYDELCKRILAEPERPADPAAVEDGDDDRAWARSRAERFAAAVLAAAQQFDVTVHCTMGARIPYGEHQAYYPTIHVDAAPVDPEFTVSDEPPEPPFDVDAVMRLVEQLGEAFGDWYVDVRSNPGKRSGHAAQVARLREQIREAITL